MNWQYAFWSWPMSSVEAKADRGASLYQASLLVFTALLALFAALFVLDWLLRTDSFPARHVRFEGEFRHVTSRELELAVRDAVRGNFLMLDLDAVKAKVESLPWVYEASVRRAWPRDISIAFREQQLVARWGAGEFVNDVGQVVPVGDEDDADLPLLEGPEGTSAQVLALHGELTALFAPLDLSIKRLALSARRSWQVELSNGLVLVLDRHQPSHKIERFVRVYAAALVPHLASIRHVDLRYANGFAVQWIGGTPPPAVGVAPTHSAARREARYAENSNEG
jgi:cell division protein FtsQ